MPKCTGYAAKSNDGKVEPWTFDRREVGPDDVLIDIEFAGICHSDLHTIKDEWGPAAKPLVPGHEIVGIVREVGPNVTKFKAGDKACSRNLENYCPGMVFTYNGKLNGETTHGGYSNFIVCKESFCLKFPDTLDMCAGAPLLCAGITVYSPLVHYGMNKPGFKLGVVGLGGLGHMAVKIGAAMGCEVTVISTTESKKEEAMSFGAKNFIVSKDEEQMKAAAGTLDGIIDTVCAKKPMAPYLSLLGLDGTLCVVGAPAVPWDDVASFSLIMKRVKLAGSLIGGIAETQEMLDFCAKHNILCEVEKINADYINTALERLEKNDVRYRFVIDVKNTMPKPE